MSHTATHRVRQLVDLRRFEEARVLVTSMLAERPDDPTLHGLHAQALLGLKSFPAALAAGNRVVGLSPEDEWGHRICSVALDRMGRAEEATVAAAEAVRLAPHEWRTHQQYALAAVDTRGRLADARAAAGRAVQLAPNEPGTHFTVGVVAQARNELEVARAAYERTLALDPEHALAQHNLTMVQGGFRLARSAQGFGRALRLAPNDGQLLPSVDALAARFITRIHIASLLALVVGLAVSTSAGDGATGRVTPVTVGVAVALTAGIVAYTWALLREVPTGIRRYVLGSLRSDRRLIVLETFALVMFAVTLVVCLVPGGSVVGLLSLRILGLANVVLLVATFSRRR